jgi:hypothetical protein
MRHLSSLIKAKFLANHNGEIPFSNSYKYLYIYFQNIRIRLTIASEPLADIYTFKFHVICLFQKWVKISCTNYNRFLRTCLVYIAEKVSDAKSHEEGPLTL